MRRSKTRSVAEIRLERERPDDVRGSGKAFRAQDAQRGDPGHDLRTVDERESFLCSQFHRTQARTLERHGARQPLAEVERFALSQERERHVRERSQIAARADRALTRHDRRHAAFERCDDEIERLRLHARVPGRKRVRAQSACGADARNVEGRAGTGGVAAHEVDLQRDRVGRVDRDVGEPPEAGGHAVDRVAARELTIHELTGPLDAPARLR